MEISELMGQLDVYKRLPQVCKDLRLEVEEKHRQVIPIDSELKELKKKTQEDRIAEIEKELKETPESEEGRRQELSDERELLSSLKNYPTSIVTEAIVQEEKLKQKRDHILRDCEVLEASIKKHEAMINVLENFQGLLRSAMEVFPLLANFDISLTKGDFLEENIRNESLEQVREGMKKIVTQCVNVEALNLGNQLHNTTTYFKNMQKMVRIFKEAGFIDEGYFSQLQQNIDARIVIGESCFEPDELMISHRFNDELVASIWDYFRHYNPEKFRDAIPIQDASAKPLKGDNFKLAVALLQHVAPAPLERSAPFRKLYAAINEMLAHGMKIEDLRVVKMAIILRHKVGEFDNKREKTNYDRSMFVTQLQHSISKEAEAFQQHRDPTLKRILGSICKFLYQCVFQLSPKVALKLFDKTTREKNAMEVQEALAAHRDDPKSRH